MTESGQGVPKDEAAAVRIYRDLADKGDRVASTYLALMIENGRGGLKADKAEAIRLYTASAKQGVFRAQSELRRLRAAR